MIMEKALKIEVVGPARVMILSGQFPSEMLIRAPLCKETGKKKKIESVALLSYDACVTVNVDMFFPDCWKKTDLPPLSSF